MTTPVEITIQQLPHAEGLPLPEYQTVGSSGMDIPAAVDEPIIVAPRSVALIPTGLRFAIPQDFEIQVRARSGLAVRHGLMVLNGPGTIDSDYRGELKIILANFSDEAFAVTRGMRVAQIVLARVERIRWDHVSDVGDTKRQLGGFGSTGLDSLTQE